MERNTAPVNSVRVDTISHQSFGQEQPLLSTRALVLIVCAVGAGVLATISMAWAVGITAGVAVLTLLRPVIGK